MKLTDREDINVWSIPLTSIKKTKLDSKSVSKNMDHTALMSIAMSKGKNINDAKNVYDMLPDLRYATEIIVASILSPKDMMPAKLNLVVRDSLLTKPFNDTNGIMTKITDFFKTELDLENKITKYLEEALVTVGSVPILILAPNEIDDIIALGGKGDISLESIEGSKFVENWDLLAKPNDSSNKMRKDLGISNIYDNMNRLKLPMVRDAIHKNKIETMMGMKSNSEKKIKTMIDMESSDKDKTLSFQNAPRENTVDGSNPIFIKLPAESVIPIHKPNDPSEHTGYYIVFDKSGYPVNNRKDSGYVKEMEERISTILKGSENPGKSVFTYTGQTNTGAKISPKDYMDIYSNKVREELNDTIQGGFFGDNIEVANAGEVYSLMFNMFLKQEEINLVYVPAKMINYIAFDYDSQGIGLSIMEKTKLFSTLRASLLLSGAYGSIKNNMGTTDVEVNLDDDDDDPYDTLEIVKHEIANMIGSRVPIGAYSPTDIIDSLQKSSVRMSINGNAKFPSTSVSVTDTQRQASTIDRDMDDMLQQQHYSGYGVTPSHVNQALSGDFAISTVTENMISARIAMVRQGIYERSFSKLIRNYMRLCPYIVNLIGSTTHPVEEFIRAVEFRLPDIDSAQLEQQLMAYNRYADAVDLFVESYMSDSMYRDLFRGDYNPNITDAMKEVISSYFKRKWLTAQGIMPELQDLIGKESKHVIKDIKDHNKSMTELMGRVLEDIYKDEAKWDDRIRVVEDKITEGQGFDDAVVDPEDDLFGAVDDNVDDLLADPDKDDIVDPEEELEGGVVEEDEITDPDELEKKKKEEDEKKKKDK